MGGRLGATGRQRTSVNPCVNVKADYDGVEFLKNKPRKEMA